MTPSRFLHVICLAAPVMLSALPAAASDRWYTPAQVSRGEPLYQAHCARCHKADASGTEDWRTPDAAGNYPPPPLDGSAHTWHHPLPVLRRTVKLGNARLGGTMPAFGHALDDDQIDAVIAWVQSNWSDEVYARWEEIARQSSKQLFPSD